MTHTGKGFIRTFILAVWILLFSFAASRAADIKVFEMSDGKEVISVVAAELTKCKMPTPRGGSWHPQLGRRHRRAARC